MENNWMQPHGMARSRLRMQQDVIFNCLGDVMSQENNRAFWYENDPPESVPEDKDAWWTPNLPEEFRVIVTTGTSRRHGRVVRLDNGLVSAIPLAREPVSFPEDELFSRENFPPGCFSLYKGDKYIAGDRELSIQHPAFTYEKSYVLEIKGGVFLNARADENMADGTHVRPTGFWTKLLLFLRNFKDFPYRVQVYTISTMLDLEEAKRHVASFQQFLWNMHYGGYGGRVISVNYAATHFDYLLGSLVKTLPMVREITLPASRVGMGGNGTIYFVARRMPMIEVLRVARESIGDHSVAPLSDWDLIVDLLSATRFWRTDQSLYLDTNRIPMNNYPYEEARLCLRISLHKAIRSIRCLPLRIQVNLAVEEHMARQVATRHAHRLWQYVLLHVIPQDESTPQVPSIANSNS